MSNLFFTSDLHHGHKSILNWQGHTRGGSDLEEHSLWLVEQWNSVVSKRDTVVVLGENGELEEDLRYFNVCVDLHDGKPVSIDTIKERKLER